MAVPNISEGQIAIDPINRIFYYIDSSGTLVNSSLNLLQASSSLISTDDSLSILGNTTIIESSVTVLKDPTITLGGNSAPSSDDNKDRGVEFRWHNGTSAKIGFFGFDDSTGKFTFIPDATNTSEVFSGSLGEIEAKIKWDHVINKPNFVNSITGTENEINVDSSTGNIVISLPATAGINISGTSAGWTNARKITLAGDLSGNVIIDGGSNVTLTANVIPNSITLGTDTTGDYVANLTAGTGLTISGGTGEQSQPIISVTNNTYDAYGAAATAELNASTDASTKATQAYNNAVSYTSSQLASFDVDDLADVTVNTSLANSYLKYNGSVWLNDIIDLGTDTSGNYVQNLVAGNGISITNNSGEGTTPKIDLNAELNDINLVDVNNETLDQNQVLLWNGNAWINGPLDELTSGYSYSTTIGDGSSTEFSISIPFNTNIANDLFVALQSATPPYEVIAVDGTNVSWEVPNNTSIKLSFNTPPASSSVKVSTFSNVTSTSISVPNIDLLDDVTITSAASGDFLKYSNSHWVNGPVNLGADTVGNYVSGVTAGIGIAVTHTPGEGSSASVALNASLDDLNNVSVASATNGQFLKYVSASSSWTPANIPSINTLDDIGDVTISGLQSGHFLKWNSTEWVNEQIDLGLDTVGNYMSEVTAGTGVVIAHTPSAGSIATISIGQAVGTASNVQFQQITTTGNLSVSGSIDTNGNLTVGGDLIVMGNTVTLNVETLVVEDKTIQLGNSSIPSNTTADGSGIIVPGGYGSKTFTWVNSTASWSSSENINLAAGKVFKINNVEVLSADGLPANSVTPTMLKEGPARSSFRSEILNITNATYTLGLSDLSKLVVMDNSSSMTVTIPSEANVSFTVGDRIDVTRYGAGSLTFNSHTGVSLRSTPGLKLRAQYSTATLTKLATNEWLIVGDLAA